MFGAGIAILPLHILILYDLTLVVFDVPCDNVPILCGVCVSGPCPALLSRSQVALKMAATEAGRCPKHLLGRLLDDYRSLATEAGKLR